MPWTDPRDEEIDRLSQALSRAETELSKMKGDRSVAIARIVEVWAAWKVASVLLGICEDGPASPTADRCGVAVHVDPYTRRALERLDATIKDLDLPRRLYSSPGRIRTEENVDESDE